MHQYKLIVYVNDENGNPTSQIQFEGEYDRFEQVKKARAQYRDIYQYDEDGNRTPNRAYKCKVYVAKYAEVNFDDLAALFE